MADCAHCGAETELYENGAPICLKCLDERKSNANKKPPTSFGSIRNILANEIVEATARWQKESRDFFEVMGQIPSGFPHPDGSQHIHNVSRALSTARMDLAKAHARLDDFLRTGIVPEDLNRSG
jgi:hypothetical protein